MERVNQKNFFILGGQMVRRFGHLMEQKLLLDQIGEIDHLLEFMRMKMFL